MADRRMFSLGVVDTDAFGSLPLGAQALYFQLAIRADDDGFVKSPKLVQKMIGAPDKYVKVLSEAGYIIRFDSGVVVIVHWKLMNKIKSDRYRPTLCRNEFAMLVEDGTGRYRLAPDGLRSGSDPAPQGSQEKEREEKIISGQPSAEENFARAYAESLNPYGKRNNVFLTTEEYADLFKDIPQLNKWIDLTGDWLAENNFGMLGHARLIRSLYKK